MTKVELARAFMASNEELREKYVGRARREFESLRKIIPAFEYLTCVKWRAIALFVEDGSEK